jgi:hypothetical protein
MNTEAFCWGLAAALAVWCFIGVFFYWRYHYCRMCLSAVLFVIGKADKRGVYFAPYDVAVINLAVHFIKHTR